MHIYEIEQKILELYDAALDEETGEIKSEEALEKIYDLEGEREGKLENLALWYKELVAEATAIKAEKMALAERQAKTEKKAEGVKKFLAYALSGEKLSTARVAVSYRKSETVEIAEGTQLPMEYLTFKDPTPNKTEIKKALKAGTKLEGCQIVTNQNIQIK